MTIRVLAGDCRETLKTLEAGSVHCCVTSPPYYNLRDYGVDGQIGMEATPEAFVASLVDVFREVRRTLRDDGTLWLNIGDSYASGPKNRTPEQAIARCTLQGHTGHQASILKQKNKVTSGLKPKDLIGIPWMLAFALRADGWYLRSDTIWAKPNGMPESVLDRPCRSHEYVFLLSKSERYYYDYKAVRLPPLPDSIKRLSRSLRAGYEGLMSGNGTPPPPGQPPHAKDRQKTDNQRGHSRRPSGFNDRWDAMERAEQMSEGSALRDVWWIAPAQCKESHFAVMPNERARLCIMAGCPAGGTVLDPFGGSGTTAIAASLIGRNAVLCELNPEYVKIQGARFAATAPLLTGGAA